MHITYEIVFNVHVHQLTVSFNDSPTYYRHSDLMASTLVSRSSSPGSSPGQDHCIVFLGKTLQSHIASPNQMYKWVPTNLMLGSNPTMNKHPIQEGSINTHTLQSHYATETGLSCYCMGHCPDADLAQIWWRQQTGLLMLKCPGKGGGPRYVSHVYM